MSDKITYQDFAKRIKEKYPQYIDLDDSTLTSKIIAKYPQYKEIVDFEIPENEGKEYVEDITERQNMMLGELDKRQFKSYFPESDYMGLFNKKEEFKLANNKDISMSFAEQVGLAASQAERPPEFLFDANSLKKRLEAIPKYFPQLTEQSDELKKQLLNINSQNIDDLKQSVTDLEKQVMQLKPVSMMLGQQMAGDPNWSKYENEVLKDKHILAGQRLMEDTERLKELAEIPLTREQEGFWDKTKAAIKGLDIGKSKGVKEYITEYNKLLDDFKAYPEINGIYEKIEKLNNNEDVEFTTDERLLMQLAFDNAQAHRKLDDKISTYYKIGESFGKSIGYQLEFLLTSAVGGKPAAAITKLIKPGMKAVPKYSLLALSKLTQAGIQTTTMPSFYKLAAQNASHGMSYGEAVLNAYWEMGAETLSERIFMKPAGSITSLNSFNKFLARTGINIRTDKGALGVILPMIEETGEEKISEILTAPKNYKDFGEFWKGFWDAEDNAVMLGSVSLMVGGMGSASVLGNSYIEAKRKGRLARYEKFVPTDLRAEIDAVLEIEDLSVKDQYDLIADAISDRIETGDLGEDPATTAGNAMAYMNYRIQDMAAETVNKKGQVEGNRLVVGKAEEGDTEAQQAQLDYLKQRGVEVPEGTKMDELGKLYDTEVAKETAETEIDEAETPEQIEEIKGKIEEDVDLLKKLGAKKEFITEKEKLDESLDKEEISETEYENKLEKITDTYEGEVAEKIEPVKPEVEVKKTEAELPKKETVKPETEKNLAEKKTEISEIQPTETEQVEEKLPKKETVKGKVEEKLPETVTPEYEKLTANLGIKGKTLTKSLGKSARNGKIGGVSVIMQQGTKENEVILESIKTPKYQRGTGKATNAMNKIIAEADKQGLTIKLRAVPEKGADISQENLIKFYQDFGFEFKEGSIEGVRTPKKKGVSDAEKTGKVAEKAAETGEEEVKEKELPKGLFENKYSFELGGGTLVVGQMKKDGRYSVIELEVPKENRRTGIATKLLNKAIGKYGENLVSQVSNDGSVDLHYKVGLRAFNENGSELTLEETKQRREKNTSVAMKLPKKIAEKKKGVQYATKIGTGVETPSLKEELEQGEEGQVRVRQPSQERLETEKGKKEEIAEKSILKSKKDLLGDDILEEYMRPVEYSKLFNVDDELLIKGINFPDYVASFRGYNQDGDIVVFDKKRGNQYSIKNKNRIIKNLSKKDVISISTPETIQYAVDNGVYDEWIKEGRISKEDIRTIIKSANIEVPERFTDKPEAKPTEKPKKVIVSKLTDRLDAPVEDLIADYKARGMDNKLGWTEFIKDRYLTPEIDAKEFYKIWQTVSPKFLTRQSKGIDFSPTHYDSLKEMNVQNKEEGGVVYHVWEDGSTGSTPKKFINDNRFQSLTKLTSKQREEAAKAKIAEGFSNLAETIGAKKSLTGEERETAIQAIQRILEGLIELGIAKGMSLKDAVRDYLKQRNYIVDEDLLDEAIRRREKPEDDFPIGTTNAKVRTSREMRGLEAIPKEERIGNEELWGKVVDKIDNGEIFPRQVVKEIVISDDVETSAMKEAIVKHDRWRILKETKYTNEEIIKKQNSQNKKGLIELFQRRVELENEMQENDLAAEKLGATWGRAGQFRQRNVEEDLSFEAIKREAKILNGGIELTIKQEQKFKELSEKYKELQKEYDKIREKERIREQQFQAGEEKKRKEAEQKLVNDIRNKVTPKSAKSVRDFDTQFKSDFKRQKLSQKESDIKERLKERLSRLANVKFAVGEEGASLIVEEISGVIQDMSELGIIKLEQGIDKIISKVKDYLRSVNKDFDVKNLDRYKDEIKNKLGIPEIENTEYDELINKLVEKSQLGFDISVKGILKKLLYNRVVAGSETIDDVVDDIYESVKDRIPNIDKRMIRDAISGYGEFRRLSKEEIDIKIRELKRQGRLDSAIEDVEDNRLPLRSGVERDKTTQETREKQARIIKEIKDRDLVPPPTQQDQETQWRNGLQAYQKRLENAIEDVKKEIDTGERKQRSKFKKYDTPELESLREELSRLREIRTAIDKETGRYAEQRESAIIKATERVIAEIEMDIDKLRRGVPIDKNVIAKRQGLFGLSKPMQEKFTSERIEELGKLKDALQQQLSELLPDAIKDKALLDKYKKQRQRRLEQLIEQQRTKDYGVKPKPYRPALDKEAIMINRDIEKLKYAIEKEKEQIRYKNMNLAERIGEGFINAWNIPKALMASIDLSAPMRQGIVMISKPKIFMKAFNGMFKYAFSEKIYEDWLFTLKTTDDYYEMIANDLYIAEPTAKLAAKEEDFMSNWLKYIDKIPLYGAVRVASERAYVGFLNKLRVDTYLNFKDKLQKQGFEAEELQNELKSYSHFINTATGRGKLKMTIGNKEVFNLEPIAALLNSAFFSPRLIASRLAMFNPAYYASMSKEARKDAIKTYFGTVGIIMGTLALSAIAFSGDDKFEIELDPRSSDFLKIRYGKIRFDLWGGHQQVARTLAQFITGKIKTGGEVKAMTGDKWYGQTRLKTLRKFFENKLSPSTALAKDLLQGGKNYEGEDITITNELINKTVPLYLKDVKEAVEEEGWEFAFIAGFPALFGVGVQTYGGKEVDVNETEETEETERVIRGGY